jgi:hypothetical protein
MRTQLNAEPILYLLFTLCAIRLYFVLIKKDKEHLFLDGLLFAAIGYACGLASIGVVGGYYVFPSVVLALPSLAYWTSYLWKKDKRISGVILLTSLFLVKDSAITSKSLAIDAWNRRETDMPVIREMARQLLDGKELIWLSKHPNLDAMIHHREWLFDVYNDFINYCLKKKTVVLKPVNDLAKIPENSVLLCPINEGDGAIDLRRVDLKDFRLVEEVFNIRVYAHNGVQWKK